MAEDNGRVILLHGLWMRGFAFAMLARKLKLAGYSVELFDYASVWGLAKDAVERLAERIVATEVVRVVGHSLGGMIAVEALRGLEHLPAGRLVCLGSPLRGCLVAKSVGLWPIGRYMLGKQSQMLAQGIAPYGGKHAVGVIAGSMQMGFGAFVPGLVGPHDGTVTVEETRLPGIADHCTVKASHTGLLFADVAHRQVLSFLEHGRFVAA